MNADQINELAEKGTFEGEPLKGRLLETHISWVILTSRFVFKIKKNMLYSFLDFSTLEKRKFYCDREVVLNRRLTDIYLDVLPIRAESGNYSIGEGKGKVVGYTVRMKKMSASRRMDQLLLKKRVDKTHMKSLAQRITTFHQQVEIIKIPLNKAELKDKFNDILSVQDWIASNLEKQYTLILKKAVSFSNYFLDENAPLMSERISKGYIRDGHGDLHSRNIFLYRDPVIFDCIEFNDSFRWIDVLNEVAFFCMDLEAFGCWGLSSQFLEDYLEIFPCMSDEEEALFRYYKCYRANVRAKVNALRAMQSTKENERGYCIEIRKYLELMDLYISKQ